MTNLARRITELEKSVPVEDGLLPIDAIVAYLQHRDKRRPGRPESVPQAIWAELEKRFSGMRENE